jgi:hypothetical protein
MKREVVLEDGDLKSVCQRAQKRITNNCDSKQIIFAEASKNYVGDSRKPVSADLN